MDPINQNQRNEEADTSLETPSTVIENPTTVTAPMASPILTVSPPQQPPSPPVGPLPPTGKHHRIRVPAPNKYLLLFLLTLFIAVAIVIAAIILNHKNSAPVISTQNLTQSELDKLSRTDLNVGSSSQILTVGASAVFGGQVLMKQDLNVAGVIKVGGSLNLPGITVTGTSGFNQIAANQLTVSGDTNIQGQLNVGKNLSVSGSGSFGGSLSVNQLSAQSLTLNSDLVLTHHIEAGGVSATAVAGSSIGAGGTVSISGSDTAGTVTINTGTSPGAGSLINVTFNTPFTSAADVVITPLSSAAAVTPYYITRSTSGFSIETPSPPGPSEQLVFDYIAVD